MKLGVFAVFFLEEPIEEMLDYVQAAGLLAVEIRTGDYSGEAFVMSTSFLRAKKKEAIS